VYERERERESVCVCLSLSLLRTLQIKSVDEFTPLTLVANFATLVCMRERERES